jgi:hypothetical protein
MGLINVGKIKKVTPQEHYDSLKTVADKKQFLRKCWVTLNPYSCDYIFPGDNLIKRGEIYTKRK